MSAISKMITPDGAAYDIRDANALRAEAAAPSFSDSASYAEGDYVTRDGLLYRATAARVAGAWNSGSGFEVFPLWKKANPYPFVTVAVSSGVATLQPFANNQMDLSAGSGATAFSVAFAASPVSDTMRDLWFVVKTGLLSPTVTWPSGVVAADDNGDNLVVDANATLAFHIVECAAGVFLVFKQVLESRVPPITAASYVQNGLVALWDAKENSGWGTHVYSASTWTDLVGNATMSFNKTANFGEDYVFTSDVSNGLWCYTSYSVSIPENFTMEVVLSNLSITGAAGTKPIMATFASNGANPNMILFQGDTSSSVLGVKVNNSQTNTTVTGDSITSGYFALTVSGGTWRLYRDGIQIHTGNGTGVAYTGAVTQTYRPRYGNYGNSANYHRMALYNRAITADEVAANYAVDVERFDLS